MIHTSVHVHVYCEHFVSQHSDLMLRHSLITISNDFGEYLHHWLKQYTCVLVSTVEQPSLSEEVRKCPICQHSNLVVKKKRSGGYFIISPHDTCVCNPWLLPPYRFMLSCTSYPLCQAMQHFPPSVIEAEPHTSMCTRVSYNNILSLLQHIFIPCTQQGQVIG